MPACLVGAARFELATFRPPAGKQWVSMRPRASRLSYASASVDGLDAWDVAFGTKAVPRASRAQIDPIRRLLRRTNSRADRASVCRHVLARDDVPALPAT
jgi:hypothetical protein